jgi:PilZ domain
VASTARRDAPRTKTLKGAEIVPPVGVNITCIVRNISTSGAQLEVHSPIPYNSFDLVFDDDEWSRRLCAVVWRRETTIGVKFQ